MNLAVALAILPLDFDVFWSMSTHRLFEPLPCALAPYPLAVVMIDGLVTSTLFMLVLPTFYLQVHGWLERRALHAEA